MELKKRKLILFDIDHTLINTDIIKKKTINDICKYFKVDEDKVKKAKDKYINSLNYVNDLNPNEMLEAIGEELNLSLIDLKKIYYNPKIFLESIYPETIRTLKSVDKEKYVLGIYSEGWDFFQKYKLESTGLIKFFEENWIYILRRKIEKNVALLPNLTMIVDDNIEVINELKKKKNIIPIWLNRKNKTIDKTIKTIFDLEQLLEIIN